MINSDASCHEIITQMTAARSAINNIMGIVMTENLKNIIEHPDNDPETQQAKLQEAINMIAKK